MPNALLRIQNLTIVSKNPERSLLNNLSLTLQKRHSLALVGENGSGKTTVIKAILGFLPTNCIRTEGTIHLGDRPLHTLSQKELQKIRGKHIATILQNAMGSLTPSMRIGEQIVETLIHHKHISKKEAYEQALELLSDVSFPNPKHCYQLYPFELSGGMRQRIVIAIALASSPELILADEPTSALDSVSQAQILQILKKVHQDNHASILLVTHNLALVSELCHDVAIIQGGNILEQGSVEDVFIHTQEAYTKELLTSVAKIPIVNASYLTSAYHEHTN